MKMIRNNTLAAAAVALVLLAGCGSTGLDDILGGGGSSRQATNEIRGTVEQVNPNDRSILLSNVSTYDAGLGGGRTAGGNQARVYFDDRTPVTWQGQTYRPTDLERGDQVAVRVQQSGNQLRATEIVVTHNISAGRGTTGTPGSFGSNVSGTISNVDTSRRIIQLNRGNYGNDIINIEYDNSTFVDANGTRYGPQNLRRGDQVEINVRDLGGGRLLATGVYLRSGGSGGTIGGSQAAVRGTVRHVDTNRRTIELEQTQWVRQFNPGSGNFGSTVTLQYDQSTFVDYQGQRHPPSNLERGDVIEAEVRDIGANALLAQRIILVRDVRSY